MQKTSTFYLQTLKSLGPNLGYNKAKGVPSDFTDTLSSHPSSLAPLIQDQFILFLCMFLAQTEVRTDKKLAVVVDWNQSFSLGSQMQGSSKAFPPPLWMLACRKPSAQRLLELKQWDPWDKSGTKGCMAHWWDEHKSSCWASIRSAISFWQELTGTGAAEMKTQFTSPTRHHVEDLSCRSFLLYFACKAICVL